MARPLRLAHRGDARTSIENTLHALRAASALPGLDGVELDVRVAGDGTPVLSHDPDLWRTHRDRRHVADLTATSRSPRSGPTRSSGPRRPIRACPAGSTRWR